MPFPEPIMKVAALQRLRAKIKSGVPAYGLWITLESPSICEMAVALGLGLIQWFGWQEVTHGMVAVLAGATGLGNLVSFAVSRKLT